MNAQDLVALMTQRAQAVQMVVRACADWRDAVAYTVDVTADQKGATIAPWGLPEEAHELLVRRAESQGLRVLAPPLRDHLEEIHTALTPAHWGIAETGTLVLDSTSEDLRLATMLSETHVLVLPESRLRLSSLDMVDTLRTWHGEPPRYVAFISGASRTADIERVLSIGVHGPQQVHLLILKEAAP
ncbi:LutC/YkgG family protein [Desulfosoma caldarium]|uniref:L-lactate dehydrogenase complex protein LldG n=1 Tax=Desulfosoma caldarium TaxID=610254 RepID=A0A3N1VSS1_9BACT|nr:lactate utilization protein [Desulfosoma caldarium]ROR02897.1 L-lactate dehydrogenase complex protein LldG [Desulfosoma caldarium]